MCRSLQRTCWFRRQTWPFSQAALEREVLCEHCLLRFTSCCSCKPFQPQTWGPLFSAMAAPSLLCSDREAPQLLPTKFPHPGPFLSTCSKERPSPWSSFQQTVSSPAWFSNSLSFLLPLFFQLWIQYLSPFPPKALPTPVLYRPPTLVGLMIQSGMTETKPGKFLSSIEASNSFSVTERIWGGNICRGVQLSARLNQSELPFPTKWPGALTTFPST